MPSSSSLETSFVERRGDLSERFASFAEIGDGLNELQLIRIVDDATADELLSDRGETRDPSPLALE